MPGWGLTAQQGQAGLEAIAGALQAQLVLHLCVDVLQGGHGRAVGVAVVPAHQGQTSQEQDLVDLETYKQVGSGPSQGLELPASPTQS